MSENEINEALTFDTTEDDLRAERDGWKMLAVYLADIHAANAEEIFSRKHESKTEKRRQAAIVDLCLIGLKTGQLVGKIASKPENVISRLEDTKKDSL